MAWPAASAGGALDDAADGANAAPGDRAPVAELLSARAVRVVELEVPAERRGARAGRPAAAAMCWQRAVGLSTRRHSSGRRRSRRARRPARPLASASRVVGACFMSVKQWRAPSRPAAAGREVTCTCRERSAEKAGRGRAVGREAALRGDALDELVEDARIELGPRPAGGGRWLSHSEPRVR